jgi:ankyrin repeat protein
MTPKGQTPLHCAFKKGHVVMAAMLLDRGANRAAQDKVLKGGVILNFAFVFRLLAGGAPR